MLWEEQTPGFPRVLVRAPGSEVLGCCPEGAQLRNPRLPSPFRFLRTPGCVKHNSSSEAPGAVVVAPGGGGVRGGEAEDGAGTSAGSSGAGAMLHAEP